MLLVGPADVQGEFTSFLLPIRRFDLLVETDLLARARALLVVRAGLVEACAFAGIAGLEGEECPSLSPRRENTVYQHEDQGTCFCNKHSIFY